MSIKEPCLNSLLFNKSEYYYNLDDLNTLKNNNSIETIWRDCDKDMTSKLRRNRIKLRKRLLLFLENYSNGIYLEKFSNFFLKFFGNALIPQQYGFSDIVNLLTHYKNYITLKKGQNNTILVTLNEKNKTIKENFHLSELVESRVHDEDKVIPDEVMNIFKLILSSYGGGISLDNLLPEYEFRSGKKLDLNKFNMTSLLELVPHLEPRFRLCSINKSQSIIYDSEQVHDCPCKNNIFSHNLKAEEEKNEEILSKEKGFSEKLFAYLIDILVEEFPQGLYLEELISVYKGFYDPYEKGLDSYNSLDDLQKVLESEKGFFSFKRQNEKIFVTAGAFYQEKLKNGNGKLNIVGFSSSYQTLDLSAFKEGKFEDVNVADIYNPRMFWVIKRGLENSQALDEMMDKMMEFYGGEIGKRFLIPIQDSPNLPGSPVVALYSQDMNFYRAILLSREDVQNVKIFYIDYGTNDSAPLSSLYYLHKRFFDIPAQAIKCGLYGVKPAHERTNWQKYDSLKFLDMAKDKSFVAYINKKEASKKLLITLYDTTGQEEVNVNQYLIKNGYAASNEFENFRDSEENIESINITDNSDVFNFTILSNPHDEVHKNMNKNSYSNIQNSCLNSSLITKDNCVNFQKSPQNREGVTNMSNLSTPLKLISPQMNNYFSSVKKYPNSMSTKGFSFQSIANIASLLDNTPECSILEKSNNHPCKESTSNYKLVDKLIPDDNADSIKKEYTKTDNMLDSSLISILGESSKTLGFVKLDQKQNEDARMVKAKSKGNSKVSEEEYLLNNIPIKRENAGQDERTFMEKQRVKLTAISTQNTPGTLSASRTLAWNNENGQSHIDNHQVFGSSTPIHKSSHMEMTFKHSLLDVEEKIELKNLESSNMNNISSSLLYNSTVNENVQEVFYSDDDCSSSSTIDYDVECNTLIPILLSNGNRIHILFINSMHYVPFPELAMLMDSSSLENISTTLFERSVEKDFILNISRSKYFYIFMLLAREGVSYVFNSKGSVPKSISLLSLTYLIYFLNLDKKKSSMDFIDSVKSQLEVEFQSVKHVSPNYTGQLGSAFVDTKNCTSFTNGKNSVSNHSDIPDSLKLVRASSLPNMFNLCSLQNAKSLSDSSNDNFKKNNILNLENNSIHKFNEDNINKEMITADYLLIDKEQKEKSGPAKSHKMWKPQKYKDLLKTECANLLDNGDENLHSPNIFFNHIQENKLNKTQEEITKDKDENILESPPTCNRILPLNNSVNYQNHLCSSLSDSLHSPSKIASGALFNNTLPFQDAIYSPYFTGENQSYNNNDILTAARNGNPPPGFDYNPYKYHGYEIPPQHFVSNIPFHMNLDLPHYNHPRFSWFPQHFNPSYGITNNSFDNQHFGNNFLFSPHFNASFRPM